MKISKTRLKNTMKTKVGSTLDKTDVLRIIFLGSLSLQEHILTHHTRKHLVY
jgi:hypothetical protein